MRLGLLPALQRRVLPYDAQNLTAAESATLAALLEVMMEEPDSDIIGRGLQRIDALVGNFSRWERLELGGALFLVEQVLGGGVRRFSTLEAPGGIQRIESWRRVFRIEIRLQNPRPLQHLGRAGQNPEQRRP